MFQSSQSLLIELLLGGTETGGGLLTSLYCITEVLL